MPHEPKNECLPWDLIPSAWFSAQRALLARIDQAVGSASAPCRPGNCVCCRGIFEIPLLDALGLAQALRQAPPSRELHHSATRLSTAMERAGWAFPHLSTEQNPNSDFEPGPSLDEAPCPLLDEAGLCRVYEARPSICRLQGHRFIDAESGEAMTDECPRLDKNAPPLRFDLAAYFAEETRLAEQLAGYLGLPEAAFESWETSIPTALRLATEELDLTFLLRGLENSDD